MTHPTKPLLAGVSRLGVVLPRGLRKDAPAAAQTAPGSRRVRDQAREAAALMAFSALTSVALASAILVLSRLGQQG